MLGDVELRFGGEVVWWRGPAPYHFVVLPPAETERLRGIAGQVTYGWGCIPATVVLGGTTFTTSIFPRAGGYMVPVKAAARRAEGVGLGDVVTVVVTVDEGERPDDAPDGPDADRAARRRPAPVDDDDFYDPAQDPSLHD